MTAFRLPSGRQKGFSLLELLVAFSIMAISLTMLYNASGGSVRQVGDIERYQYASALAESLLALEDAVPATGWNDSGSVDGFVWRISSSPLAVADRVLGPGAPRLHQIGLLITWSERGQEKRLSLATLLPQQRPAPGSASP